MKKTKINHINEKENKCFRYAVAVALNHREIGKNLRIILKFKPLINIIINITGKE